MQKSSCLGLKDKIKILAQKSRYTVKGYFLYIFKRSPSYEKGINLLASIESIGRGPDDTSGKSFSPALVITCFIRSLASCSSKISILLKIRFVQFPKPHKDTG